jgi:methylated-DNA-[protein]-cysteine S-methyltransferase
MNPKNIISEIKNDKRLSRFERSVYLAILHIPKGQTRSYKWVAERINSPNSARAVGNALNKNPYAPLVPCHRVIKSDGSWGGYAKGPAEKMRMLKRECCRQHHE